MIVGISGDSDGPCHTLISSCLLLLSHVPYTQLKGQLLSISCLLYLCHFIFSISSFINTYSISSKEYSIIYFNLTICYSLPLHVRTASCTFNSRGSRPLRIYLPSITALQEVVLSSYWYFTRREWRMERIEVRYF